MFDAARTLLHRAITTSKGDSVAPIRWQKAVARGVNDLLGQPLCSGEELAKRRAAEVRLAELLRSPEVTTVKREPAPVMVYFEKDRNQRELDKVQALLGTHGIAAKLCDVSGDEATMRFVMREAKCERDELPVVFVAGSVVGGYRELVAFDTRGELKRAVFGG